MPPTVIVSVSFLLVSTSLPSRLSDAVTAALPKSFALIAFIRSPTVSVPVDLYVVALAPAPIVIVPPARIPRSDRGVLIESAAVPVPVAGDGDELEEDEEDAPEELDDDEPVLPFKMSWIAADNWEWTRLRAVWLAMLARPLPKLVSAEPMALITESVAEMELSFAWACCQ